MFLLYISAQMSKPPSIHRFLSIHSHVMATRQLELKPHSPQGSSGFYHDLFFTVRETGDQYADDVLALQ